MSKKILASIITIILMLSACGTTENVSFVPDSVEEDIPVVMPETITISVEEALMAYTDYLKKIYTEENKSDGVRYTLAYINDDDIPELILMDGDFHAAGAHVLICDNDRVVSDIGEFGEYGSLAYLKKKGMILSYYTGQGTSYADFYKLEGLSLIDDTYFEMDTPVIEGDKTRYYVDGDETDEVSYYEAYSSKKTTEYTYVYYDDALSYADTDDILRVLEEFVATGKNPSIINVESEYPDLVGEWILSNACIGSSMEYVDASSIDATSYLKISSNGIKFKMTYEGVTVEDDNMAITYIQTDAEDKRFSCIGFKNQEGTRQFLVFTGENNTVTANVTDLSGTFSSYSFILVYIKTEEEQL